MGHQAKLADLRQFLPDATRTLAMSALPVLVVGIVLVSPDGHIYLHNNSRMPPYTPLAKSPLTTLLPRGYTAEEHIKRFLAERYGMAVGDEHISCLTYTDVLVHAGFLAVHDSPAKVWEERYHCSLVLYRVVVSFDACKKLDQAAVRGEWFDLRNFPRDVDVMPVVTRQVAADAFGKWPKPQLT